MQLLVDGLNSQRQADPNAKGVSTMIIAPRVSLENARPWVLDTDVPPGFKVPTYTVPGFCINEEDKLTFRNFTVVEASQSVAGRLNYTDQLGMITLAFYGLKGGARGAVGTKMGVEQIKKLAKADPNLVMGTMQAVVNIRYVDADSPEFAALR